MTNYEKNITYVPIVFAPGKSEYKFQLNHSNPQPSLYEVVSDSDRRPTGVGSAYFPNNYSFLCEDNVYDPSTQSMRVVRYVKGEMSIFADEQTAGEHVKAERLEFTQKNNGVVTVPKTNKQLLQFLSITDYNGSKENRDSAKKAMFRYVDENKLYNKHIESELVLDKAKSKAINCSFEELLDIAMGLEPAINIEGKEEEAIRWNVLARAKADPQDFLETISNPDTKKKSMLRKAENSGVIRISPNGMSWANGQMFLIIPPGQNPYNFFVGQKSAEMQAVYDAILSLYEAKLGKKTKVAIKNSVPELTEDSSSIDEKDGEILQAAGKTGLVNKMVYSTEAENLYTEALKKGIFQRSPNAKMLSKWINYSDKYANKKVWMDRLSSNPDLIEKLKSEIESK
jgi:hypothetical protein